MIPREFFSLAAGNLWRMRLRTALTSLGVAIGIGALVTMLSFSNGIRTNVARQYNELGLFRTLEVMSKPIPGLRGGDSDEPARHRRSDEDPPDVGQSGRPDTSTSRPSKSGHGDSSSSKPAKPGRPDANVPPLNQAALDQIAAIPGVSLVYPEESFDGQVEWSGRQLSASIQALPQAFIRQRSAATMQGRFFASDSSSEAVLSRRWITRHHLKPDSLLGKFIVIRSTGAGNLLLALAKGELARHGLSSERMHLVDRAGKAILPAIFGPTTLTLKVVGITEVEAAFGMTIGNVLIPVDTAKRIDHLSFSNPLQLLATISGPSEGGWRMLVVDTADERSTPLVRARLEKMGFHVFSFLDQFEQVRKSFLLFDALVGALGFMALVIAGLGIANTMVMSILERTREIGVMKSLGAEEGQIRWLFLVESSLIGLIGSLAGLLLGTVAGRIGAAIIRHYMTAQGAAPLDMFHLNVGIALGSIAFGVLLSLGAGLYPAARAAQTDPVEALRHD